MSMTRNKIEAAKKMAQDFITRCDDALLQLDRERGQHWKATAPDPITPNDYSFGSKRTGTLRRRSMDLTRILAELRK